MRPKGSGLDYDHFAVRRAGALPVLAAHDRRMFRRPAAIHHTRATFDYKKNNKNDG
jgi:hypothetical protein